MGYLFTSDSVDLQVDHGFLITCDDCQCFPYRCHFDPLSHQAEERQSIEELDQAAFDTLDPSLIRFV